MKITDEKRSDRMVAYRPLRIAMIAPPWYELPPPGYGGLEQMVAALTDGLVARGHNVTLFGVGRTSGTAAEFIATMREPQHRRIGQAIPELVHITQVNEMIAGGSFDIVHDHTMVGLVTAPHRAVPTVVTVHGSLDGELGEYFGNLGESVSFVAISRAQRRIYPELPWAATIHHGLPAVGLTPRANPPGPVLWLARFTPEKGPDLAIKACRAAGLPLVLAGKCNEPAERQYLDAVIRPLLGPDVTLILNADRHRSEAMLRNARCLLMPIRWEEPFGLVMIEAMGAGTPVVALARGAVPEVVQNGETGFICTDPADLPDALRHVTDLDPEACVHRARTWFSPEVMVRRYEAVYRDQARLSELHNRGAQARRLASTASCPLCSMPPADPVQPSLS